MTCEYCGGETKIVKQWSMGKGRNKIEQIVKIYECIDCGTRRRIYERLKIKEDET